MFRSSRLLQITALFALSLGAGTLLFLTARYLKRKRREPSTGKSSSYNDRPLRRKRTFTAGKDRTAKWFDLNNNPPSCRQTRLELIEIKFAKVASEPTHINNLVFQCIFQYWLYIVHLTLFSKNKFVQFCSGKGIIIFYPIISESTINLLFTGNCFDHEIARLPINKSEKHNLTKPFHGCDTMLILSKIWYWKYFIVCWRTFLIFFMCATRYLKWQVIRANMKFVVC